VTWPHTLKVTQTAKEKIEIRVEQGFIADPLEHAMSIARYGPMTGAIIFFRRRQGGYSTNS